MFDRSILVRVWITCIIISNSNIWIPFLFTPFTPISLACMLLQVAITLFSPAHPHAHFMFLLSSQTWSLDVSLEKCHTLPIIIHYTVFIISHVSTVLWYHSVPKLSFSPPHTQSPLVFHFVFLSMGFSHTPYMSLHMTHTTKITLSLSLSPVDTTFVAVSFSSPSQTDIIHLFTDQTTPTTVSSLSLSQTHTHTHTQLLLPLPFPTTVSLSHTQNSRFRTPTRISLTNIYRLASR